MLARQVTARVAKTKRGKSARGTVSLVMRGTITPMSDANELRQKLQEIFQPTDTPKVEAAQ